MHRYPADKRYIIPLRINVQIHNQPKQDYIWNCLVDVDEALASVSDLV